MLTNHERFEQTFKVMIGEVLSTAEIKDTLRKRFSEMSEGSMLPNDHAQGNKSACWCATTGKRIFDKIHHGLYRVRKF
jgi:hypothetical protein